MRRYLLTYLHIVDGAVQHGSRILERQTPFRSMTDVLTEETALQIGQENARLHVISWDELPAAPSGLWHVYAMSYVLRHGTTGDWIFGAAELIQDTPIATTADLRAAEEALRNEHDAAAFTIVGLKVLAEPTPIAQEYFQDFERQD